MISDTLFEARAEILRYLQDFPDSYKECRVEIEHVLDVMQGLQQSLDCPFAPDEKE